MGTVAWTSLKIREQPLVQYAVNDLVEIDTRACDCGSTEPLMIFHRRVDETFFLYGITFNYEFFLEIIDNALGTPVELEIKVVHSSDATDGVYDRIVLILDESLRESESLIKQALCLVHPLSELVWSNLVSILFEFVASEHFSHRKSRRVIKDAVGTKLD